METSDRARSSPYRHRRWLAPLAAVVALAVATTLYGMGSAQAATTTLVDMASANGGEVVRN